MSSLAYADPAVETPAYIHWPQPDKPQRPSALFVSLGVAAVVTCLSGASVISAMNRLPDIDPAGRPTSQLAYAATPAEDFSATRLVTFTPPADYDSTEAPVIPAVYTVADSGADSGADYATGSGSGTAVQMKAETHFDDADLAAIAHGDDAASPSPCSDACTPATPDDSHVDSQVGSQGDDTIAGNDSTTVDAAPAGQGTGYDAPEAAAVDPEVDPATPDDQPAVTADSNIPG